MGKALFCAGLHQRNEPGLPWPEHIWILRTGHSDHSSCHSPELWSPVHTLCIRTQALCQAVQVRPQCAYARSLQSAHSSICRGAPSEPIQAALQERQRPEKGPSLAISCRTARQGLSTRGVASRRSPLHVELGLECFQMVS